MTDWGDLLRFGLNSAMLALTALGLTIAALMPTADRWNKRFFMGLFATNLLCMATSIIDLLVYTNPDMETVEQIVAALEYLLLPLPMPMFTAYLLHVSGEGWQRSGMFRSVIASYGVFLLLLFIAQFTTFLYYVTPDNHFCRGPWHPLLMAFMVMPFLLNLCGVVRLRSKLPPKYYAAFLVYLLPLAAALMVHAFFFLPEIVFTGVVLSTLSMFGIILHDQIDRQLRQQRKIAQQRASLMVLEMRPHFIYNAMMSIYYLCAKDPQKAQQVTLDFTTYLRKNFTAIASEDTVPFSDELEHTRAYLAIEQVQFEDQLIVDWDTPHTRFRVPPLTLQPIVENAVKHGMDPEAEPLHISIRTRETESGSEIIVEDNGSGFLTRSEAELIPLGTTRNEVELVPLGVTRSEAELVPGEGDAKRSGASPLGDDAEPIPVKAKPANAHGREPHTALANIRERLEMMCNGKLTIQPREGGGTVVKVTIP